MKFFTAALVAATLTAGSASAATLDFLAEANSAERGEADGTVLPTTFMDGIAVTVSAGLFTGPGEAFAYLDKGDAGLGACKELTSTKQCNPSSDDNVTSNEFVTIAFDMAYDLSGFVFRAANHNVINASSTQTLLTNINGAGFVETTFGALATGFALEGVTSLSLGFGGSSPNQFYLSSVNAEESPFNADIPLPASLPLMLAGLGGLGIASRRRRKD